MLIYHLISVASQKPYRIVFNTDGNEVQNAAGDMSQLSEEALAPAGIIGFSLDYWQLPC
jgi:hypothetical protein